MMTKPTKLSRFVFATLGLFVFSTINWLLWGLATPGDYFANGSSLLMVSAFLVGAFGVYVGARIRSKRQRILMMVGTLACLLFWGLARSGWWAHPPPPAKTGAQKSQRNE